MTNFAASIAAIATAIWIGAIVFQSFVVAPTVFASLDGDAARRFLRAVFPRFYVLGMLCGGTIAAALLPLGFAAGWTPYVLLLLAAAAAMLLAVVVSFVLVPRINAARDAGASGEATFNRLHRLSVLLTVGILILGIATLAALTINRIPAGS